MLGRGAPDANPGSKKVTRKSMDLRSNVKGVPEVPTSKRPEEGRDISRIRKGDISKAGNVRA
jgi:hypothetical protein